jgi:GT2 family glycosyltransferase
MTLLSTFRLLPVQQGDTVAPSHLDLADLSIVVPVKNNQAGVERLLTACLTVFPPHQCPAEIVLVDNLSAPPVDVPAQVASALPVRLVVCSQPGAAAARNVGARLARTQWILFLDSDCLPTVGLLDGYRRALSGAIGYAGGVQAEHTDTLSAYYDTQGILRPLPVWDQGIARPAYLITANVLVWRPALAQIGGLDERFPAAGGEDIDLGLRLWAVGPLAYASSAQVLHTFDPQLRTFVRRFLRYGHGNRLLSARYGVDLAPQLFVPRIPSLINRLLATLQFLTLWWGYHTAHPAKNWARPPIAPAWSTRSLTGEPSCGESIPLSACSEAVSVSMN